MTLQTALVAIFVLVACGGGSAAGPPVVVSSSFGQDANGRVHVHGTLPVGDPVEPYMQSDDGSRAPSSPGTQIPPALVSWRLGPVTP